MDPVKEQSPVPIVPDIPIKKNRLVIQWTMFVIVILIIGTVIYTNARIESKFTLPSNTSASPTSTPQNTSVTPSVSNSILQTSLPYSLMYSVDNALYKTNGITHEKLIDVENSILSIAPNHDGSQIAVIYKSGNNSSMFDYYRGKLLLFRPQTKERVNLLTASDITVTYPIWSSDNRFLSVWVNSGDESFIFDVLKQQPVFSIKKTGNIKVNPILFFDNSNTIVYIENNTLFKSNINGTNKTILASDVSPTRPVHEGPSLPNIPLFSPDGKYISYFSLNGDLNLLNYENKTSTIIAKGIENDIFGVSPGGYPIGFISNTQLLYNSTSYEYGSPAPLYVYDIPSQAMRLFTSSPSLLTQGSADLSSVFIFPDTQSIIVHSVITNQGLEVYKTDGTLKYDCAKTDFRYSFYNWGGGPNYAANYSVWSPDGKYIVSEGPSLSVLDTTTCKMSSVSTLPVNFAVWTL